ncbi:MAG TPA: hypothetical protein VMF30_00280, partial [Pirellulales bacterium]|nr:hypothetical protein [Pirellulales bacterium]
ALRLATYIASEKLKEFRGVEQQLQGSDGVEPPMSRVFENDPWNWSTFHVSNSWERQWLDTTPLVSQFWWGTVPTVWSLVAEETDLRATKIILALEAWRLEHGQLPDKLDELVPSLLDSVPSDPIYAKSFFYYPDGMPQLADDRLLLSSAADVAAAQKEADEWNYAPRVIKLSAIAGRPTLWSALSPLPWAQIVSLEHRGSGETWDLWYYDLDKQNTRWIPQNSVGSVLAGGQAYVIPSVDSAAPE